MKSCEVLEKLGVTRVTLCDYVKRGVIKATKKNRQYDYDEASVYEFLGMKFEKKKKVNISYSRVSTQSQKNSSRSKHFEYIIHV